MIWIVLTLAVIGYDSFRELFTSTSKGKSTAFGLPALNPPVRIGLRIFALMFYLAAWRLVLKEKPKGGRGLLIGFAVFYLFGMTALAFIKTLMG